MPEHINISPTWSESAGSVWYTLNTDDRNLYDRAMNLGLKYGTVCGRLVWHLEQGTYHRTQGYADFNLWLVFIDSERYQAFHAELIKHSFTVADIQIDAQGVGYKQISLKDEERVWATIYSDGSPHPLVVTFTLTPDSDELALRIFTHNPEQKFVDIANNLLPPKETK